MKIFDYFMENPYWKSVYENAPSSECREYYRIMFEYFSFDSGEEDKEGINEADERLKELMLTREDAEYTPAGMKVEEPRISSGSACFLIRDDSLKTYDGAFWDYLKKEGFRTWGVHGNWGCEWVYVNVNSKLFAPGMQGIPITRPIVSKYPRNALSIDEFKTIWDILKKHEETE